MFYFHIIDMDLQDSIKGKILREIDQTEGCDFLTISAIFTLKSERVADAMASRSL
jgi:hypothetical protein